MKKPNSNFEPTERLKKGRAGLVWLAVGLAWLLAACAEFVTPTPVPAQVGQTQAATAAASPTSQGALAPIPTVVTTAPAPTTAARTTSVATTSVQTTSAATTAARTTQAVTTAAHITTASTTQAATTRAVTTAPGETLNTPKATVGATITPKAPATTFTAGTTAAGASSQNSAVIKKSKFLQTLAGETYTLTPKVTYNWTAYEDEAKDYRVIFLGKGQGGDYMCDTDGLQSYEGPKNLPELIDGGYRKLTSFAATPLIATLNKLPCSTEDRRLSITSPGEATEVRDRYTIEENGDELTDNLTGLVYTLQNHYYVTGDGVYFIFNNKLWKIEED